MRTIAEILAESRKHDGVFAQKLTPAQVARINTLVTEGEDTYRHPRDEQREPAYKGDYGFPGTEG